MNYSYLIIGAGKQGTAAAYDLAKFGDAKSILFADMDEDAARRAAKRINRLIGRELATSVHADASEVSQLASLMDGIDVALSAVPYYFNLGISKVCIEKGVSLCDMGGNTDIVWEQIELDENAKAAGISIVPDCGMGPGLINTMGVYVMDLLDKPREVLLYDAGLPLEPVAPWNYAMTYHINGLTNEYSGDATFIRDGKIAFVPTFTEHEMITFEPLGELETFVISGSMSTTPQTHLGKLERYENKVLRYPGHIHTFEAYKRLGLFSEEEIDVKGQSVVPRELYHTLLAPHINADNVKDIGIMRAIGIGEKDGEEATVTVDIVDRFDEETGFTAMERLTGFHCAVMMCFQARQKVDAGAHRMELAVSATEMMEALRERGINYEVRWD